MYLIGSQALAHSINLPAWRRPADYDLIATPNEVEMLFDRHRDIVPHQSKQYPGKWGFSYRGKRYEIDSTENESNQFLRANRDRLICGYTNLDIDTGVYVIRPSTCYVYKRSHAGIPIHVEKTFADLIFLTEYFCGTDENDFFFLHSVELDLLKLLTSEAEARDSWRKRRINFNKPKEEFFKPAEHLRQMDHDSLHDLTCRWPELGPLYRDNLVNPDKALISMQKFNSRPLDYRLTMVQEEAIVIGLERFWMNNQELSQSKVYKLGLTKFVSSMCKGEFQKFCLDNIHLLKKPMWNFLENVRNELYAT